MSRPQKIHNPIKGAFNNILAAIAQGTGQAKAAANKAAAEAAQKSAQQKSGGKK